jgi:Putative prokaryotic signal transducing protein
MENRVMVFSTSMQHAAQIVKDRLEAEGINAIILNQQDSMYKTFGYIEVYVHDGDVEKAKSIVEDYKE